MRDLIEDRKPFGEARDALRERIANRVRRKLELRGRFLSDTATRKIARGKQSRLFAEGIWPALKPKDLLTRLYTDPEYLAQCAQGVLTEEEQQALHSDSRPKWTRADHVLLDEIAAFLDEPPTFGHVVLDEAQDLSAMQLRAVARRCAGTATILGDLAQQTTPWGLPSLQDILKTLGHPGEIVTLNTSYRVPQQILDIANRLLGEIAPDLPTTTSARQATDAVDVIELANLKAVARTLAETVHKLPIDKGSVGVIAADPDVEPLRKALKAEGVDPVNGDEIDRERRLALIPVGTVKGMEFDCVVIVDPHRVIQMGETGLRLLYVALTRANSQLTIVHTEALPDALGLTA
ncbi:3'-5' exonuclease [Actinocrispum sp. NPDC049592]|uniref:3'-5' exonuclease n=1 Tax=Actinocrispum sp. NPDC049592 TaxID=3154835 RepID=UPI003434F8FF